ncbi:hypothetical protein N0Y54_17315 [Nostoc punctiforme UO1]|uniref:hypothetical protein n=1 Tax=Nostoc punctiforme TaxID=272131 RepID=UPI003099D347
MTSGISTVRATDPSLNNCNGLIEAIATSIKVKANGAVGNRRLCLPEGYPNPATVRLLASEQSNTNRGPKQWHLCNCLACERF